MTYASSVRGENLFQVKAIYHRNDPIILGNPPGRPPYAVGTMATCFARAGQIKAELQKTGVPDVVDVIEIFFRSLGKPGQAVLEACGNWE